MSYQDLFQVDATLIANEFLDRYMPHANGDYVKVYLYLIRNKINGIDVSTVAENLELTEGDVRRAMRYWEDQGILSVGKPFPKKETKEKVQHAGGEACLKGAEENTALQDAAKEAKAGKTEQEPGAVVDLAAAALRASYKKTESRETISRLAESAEFKELLFIVQKYLGRPLTDNDQQVFAYLYDGLHLPAEVLDYLVDYCVQQNHNSIKYIEKVGLDWATIGIRTVEAAKERTKSFDRMRTEKTQKQTVSKSRRGISRNTDYDALMLEQVVRNQKKYGMKEG